MAARRLVIGLMILIVLLLNFSDEIGSAATVVGFAAAGIARRAAECDPVDRRLLLSDRPIRNQSRRPRPNRRRDRRRDRHRAGETLADGTRRHRDASRAHRPRGGILQRDRVSAVGQLLQAGARHQLRVERGAAHARARRRLPAGREAPARRGRRSVRALSRPRDARLPASRARSQRHARDAQAAEPPASEPDRPGNYHSLSGRDLHRAANHRRNFAPRARRDQPRAQSAPGAAGHREHPVASSAASQPRRSGAEPPPTDKRPATQRSKQRLSPSPSTTPAQK